MGTFSPPPPTISVLVVAHDGVAHVLHVQPQLVAAARVGGEPHERGEAAGVRRQHEPAAARHAALLHVGERQRVDALEIPHLT